MKNLATAIVPSLSSASAFADAVTMLSDEALRRVAGTCLVKQDVALDNGSQSIEVLSRAIVAGCNPVITSHLVRSQAINGPEAARILVSKDAASDPIFVLDMVLTERATSVIDWLHSDRNQSAFRKAPTRLASR